MPESLRAQIERAIITAADEAQRLALLAMLSMYDAIEDVRHTIGTVDHKVDELSSSFRDHVSKFDRHDAWEKQWREEHFRGIPAETHVDHHEFVAGVSADRRQQQELIGEAKKGFASQAGKMLAVAIGAVICAMAGAVGVLTLLPK